MNSNANALPVTMARGSIEIESDAFSCDHLSVRRFEGREAVSELSRFDVVLVARKHVDDLAPLDPDQVIGAKVTLRFRDHAENVVRSLSGEVVSMRQRVDEKAFVFATYELVVQPRAHRLAMVVTQEIFLNQSIVDIIKTKIENVGLADDADYRLQGTYDARDFVLQFGESDLAFISRLCEQAGIAYHFEEGDDGDKIVFTDANEGFTKLDPDTVQFDAKDHLVGVYELATRSRMVQSTFAVQEYDYDKPLLDLFQTFEAALGVGGIVDFGSLHWTPEDGQNLAKIRLDELHCLRRVSEGASRICGLAAGTRFKLVDHPLQKDGDLLVTEVRHSFEPTLDDKHEGDLAYHNSFSAIPFDQTFRPRRATPIPRMELVTAIVQGANSQMGSAADLDSAGRYLVRFYFDMSADDATAKSCRIRMAQPFAGWNEGMHFPLRPGTEVLIGFIGGHPDRPVIVGALPNAITPSVVTSSDSPVHRVKSMHGLVLEFGRSDGQR